MSFMLIIALCATLASASGLPLAQGGFSLESKSSSSQPDWTKPHWPAQGGMNTSPIYSDKTTQGLSRV